MTEADLQWGWSWSRRGVKTFIFRVKSCWGYFVVINFLPISIGNLKPFIRIPGIFIYHLTKLIIIICCSLYLIPNNRKISYVRVRIAFSIDYIFLKLLRL